MPQIPPPLDPNVAELLRATELRAPPAGAKGRVRSQLALAGVVGALHQVGAGPTVTSTVPEPSRISQDNAWRNVVETARSGRAMLATKPTLALLAVIAIGTGTLLSSNRNPIAQPTQRVRQEEIVRSLPPLLLDTVVHDEIEPAPASSAPSLVTPRPAPTSLKRPGVVETLGYEQRLLARARAALGHGELDAATQELDRHARLFPNGTLKEERDALRIVTLAQQGNLTAARERAARFRRAYPRSIQTSTVDGAVAERP